MSANDLERFEKQAQQRIAEFIDPTKKRAPPSPSVPSAGITVTLAVRQKRLALDEYFIHHSSSISKLEATIEAEQAARAAGWKIVGHVADYKHHLLKMKNFRDDEFRIVGVQQGKPYFTGDEIYEVPIWVLESHRGGTFTAIAQGNMQEKHQLWEERSQHLGRLLTVKFHYLSESGIPQLPVALRFREDL